MNTTMRTLADRLVDILYATLSELPPEEQDRLLDVCEKAVNRYRIAILCSGLSVRKHDLAKIACPVIGVNWSVLGYPHAAYHVISNKVLIKKHYDSLPDLSPHAIERISNKEIPGAFVPDTIMNYCNIRHYNEGRKIPRLPDGYGVHKHGWVFAGGGPCALQVAISLGYKEIIFVGLDLEHGADMHFYSHENGAAKSEYSGYNRTALTNAWTVQREYFEQTKEQFIDEWGLRIVNAGYSKVFERVVFEDVFNNKDT